METFNLDIVSSNSLTQIEKELILAGSSIAAHSACYWNSDEGANWPVANQRLPDWAKNVIGADFVGGVGRFLVTTAAATLAGGPVGTSSAIGYAVGTSAAVGMLHAIDWALSEFTDWW
ncbi:MAG: hypothetical protein HKN51_10930 [Saprospiraceae bacterium]|nr:hypothetical protein [Saprospiraceae bacterium]